MSLPLRPPDENSQKLSPFAILFFVVIVPMFVTYTMATGNEFRQAAVFIGLLVGGVILARPFWGLLLFIALVYIRPEESIVELQGLRLPLLVSVTTLVATIFHKLINREHFIVTPLGGMMVGFGVTAMISGVIVGMGSVAAQDIVRLVILVLLMLNLVSDEKRYQQTTSTVLLFTTYLAVYSIYLYFAGGAMDQHGLLRSKATGIFSDPNDTAGTIVPGLAMTLFRIRSVSSVRQYFYVVLSLILTLSIFLTHSRGGFLALLTVIIAYFVLSFRPKQTILIVTLVIPLLFFGLASSRMANFDSSEESANSRFQFWITGVLFFIQKPIFGIGYKGFPDINDGMTAHNSFVLCFTELGFIGYFFWMGCLYLAFCKSSYMTTRETNPELLAIKVALAGFLMAGFWISRTYVPILYLLTCLAFIKKNIRSEKETKTNLNTLNLHEMKTILILSAGSIMIIYIMAKSLA